MVEPLPAMTTPAVGLYLTDSCSQQQGRQRGFEWDVHRMSSNAEAALCSAWPGAILYLDVTVASIGIPGWTGQQNREI